MHNHTVALDFPACFIPPPTALSLIDFVADVIQWDLDGSFRQDTYITNLLDRPTFHLVFGLDATFSRSRQLFQRVRESPNVALQKAFIRHISNAPHLAYILSERGLGEAQDIKPRYNPETLVPTNTGNHVVTNNGGDIVAPSPAEDSSTVTDAQNDVPSVSEVEKTLTIYTSTNNNAKKLTKTTQVIQTISLSSMFHIFYTDSPYSYAGRSRNRHASRLEGSFFRQNKQSFETRDLEFQVGLLYHRGRKRKDGRA